MRTFIIAGTVLSLIVGGVLVVHHHDKLQAQQPPQPLATGASLIPGTYSGSILTQDGRTRTYVIHIPAGYAANKSYPLVLLFHGGMGTGDKILSQTNFAATADASGFILVAPDGVGNDWNNGLDHAKDPEDASIDDVGFVRQLITKLEAQLPIDHSRIYATGASAGGMMTERLGCQLSDVLAAIGPDVGPMPTSIAPVCDPTPIPVIGIQGGADPLVPLEGGALTGAAARYGEEGNVLSAAASMQLWAGINDCSSSAALTHVPPTANDGTSVDEYTFSGCKADVVYYIVEGMGHDWPPNQGVELVSGKTSQNLNATDVIWAFFVAHPKQ